MSTRTWRTLIALTALALLPAWVQAQERRPVTGQVTSAMTGEPLPGVNVQVEGTNLATVTNEDGRYRILVPEEATTLVFSLIGYQSTEVEITGVEVNVDLETAAIGLEGLVVTALGVEREKRALSTSVQDVAGADITAVPEVNLVNALQGSVSGVKITNAGPQGGTSRIVIRGASSITGNNQPLFVVDGVPIDNSSPTNSGFGGGSGNGIDYGNAAGMIDASNIQSISVLKGPNAAALYGSRAANGAVVITTMDGSSARGMGITVTHSSTFESPLRLPDYQDRYGQGSNGQFEWVDGQGGGTFDYFDESWGPPMDCQPIDQFYGSDEPFCPQPDNVRNFFDLGVTNRTNASFATAGEEANVRLSITNMNLQGMFPGNELNNTGVALNGGVGVTDALSTRASVNYLRETGDRRVGTGYDAQNPMQQFIWFGRQVDTERLRDWRCEEGDYRCTPGDQFNWNYNYHNNPYFEQFGNNNHDETDRVIGHVALDYRLADWVTATLRSGTDWYREHRKIMIAHSDLENPEGALNTSEIYRRETNTELRFAGTRRLSDDLTLRANVGGNHRWDQNDREDVGVTVLNARGIYNVSNAGATPVITQLKAERLVYSLFGSAELSYRDYLFFDATARNDWSSTLPAGSNSYFYPSLGASLIFTDVFDLRSDVLSYGKIRANWTEVGSDTNPYQLTPTYQLSTRWSGVAGYRIPNRLPNAQLKPERTNSWEAGVELDFFNDRVGLVGTYYDASTFDQIIPLQISAASGYTSRVINVGEVRNRGVELLLNGTVLRTDDFTWDLGLNWADNRNTVVDLYTQGSDTLKTLQLGADYWGLTVEARRGEPYGQLYGFGYLRNEDGEVVVDDDGMPITDFSQKVLLGNYNPDWNGGLTSRFTYGSIDLGLQLDYQRGGEIFSTTRWFGLYAGVLEETLRGRENGPCDPGIVFDGVTSTGEANDQTICPQDYFEGIFNNHERGIVDASYVKLREARLGFVVPTGWVERLGFSSAHVALIGRNLWLGANAVHIDPETAFDASNRQGIEFGQLPTPRSFGFTLTVRP